MASYEAKTQGTVNINAPVIVVIPKVPNFLQIEPGDGRAQSSVKPVDVSTFTPEQLKLIGQQWTEKLIAHAAKRRAGVREEEGYDGY
jgi:hypothetical protein